MPELRKWIDELMIYDGDDTSCTDEAKATLASAPGKIAIEGLHSAHDLSAALRQYVNLKQITFTTHGFPGGVYFKGGSLTAANLSSVSIPPALFQHEGRLLFMGCETARTQAGEDFLVAAAKRFFAGKGGIVGGATIYAIGLSSGARLPILGGSSSPGKLPEQGKLILYRIDTAGNVVARSSARPFGL